MDVAVQTVAGRAEAAFQNGDYALADDLYRDAILGNEQDPTLLKAHGLVLAKLGHYKAAAHSFQQALRLDPADADTRFQLGLALFHLGRNKAALEEYRQVIQLKPENVRSHARLGYLLDDLGRADEAKEEYAVVEKAYRADAASKHLSDNPDVWADYGRVLMALTRREEALPAYRRAIDLYQRQADATPDDPDIHAGLGFALDDLDDSERAEREYERAVELRPADCISSFNLGVVRERRGEIDEAIVAYRKAAEVLPEDDDVLAALGSALAKAGRCQEAEDNCRKAIALNPKNANAWEALGIALAGQERYAEADTAYSQSLKLDQDEDTAQRYCKMLLDRDQPERAEEIILRQLDASFSWRSLAIRAAIDASFAEKYQDDSYYRQCADDVVDALKKVPLDQSPQDRIDLARLYYQRGSAYVMLSEYGKAKADYLKCVGLAERHSAVSLSATRTIRRINANQRRPVDVPRWLSYFVTSLAVAGVGYGVWLVERGRLPAAEFFPIALGLVLVVFAAFCLPAITTLKLGPAEFDKQVVTLTIAPPDKLKS